MRFITETSIDGAFFGWSSAHVYRLANGQQWIQADAKRRPTYLEAPRARIWRHGTRYYLDVHGMDEAVEVFLLPHRATDRSAPRPPACSLRSRRSP